MGERNSEPRNGAKEFLTGAPLSPRSGALQLATGTHGSRRGLGCFALRAWCFGCGYAALGRATLPGNLAHRLQTALAGLCPALPGHEPGPTWRGWLWSSVKRFRQRASRQILTKPLCCLKPYRPGAAEIRN